jgi:hypothetical protein
VVYAIHMSLGLPAAALTCLCFAEFSVLIPLSFVIGVEIVSMFQHLRLNDPAPAVSSKGRCMQDGG